MELIHFVPKAQCHRLRRIFPGEAWPLVMEQFAFEDKQLQELRKAQQQRILELEGEAEIRQFFNAE